MGNPLSKLPVMVRVLAIPSMLQGADAEQLAMAVVQTRQLEGDDMVEAIYNARKLLTEANAVLERIQAGSTT